MKRQFTVTPHRPWRTALLALLAIGALATSGWWFLRPRALAQILRDDSRDLVEHQLERDAQGDSDNPYRPPTSS